MKPPARKESEIQREILRYLQARGIFAWKAGVGAVSASYRGKARFVRFGVAGCVDIIAILPGGIFWGIEVKSTEGKLTPAQYAFWEAVEKAGGRWTLARSVQDVDASLSREGVRWSSQPPAN